MKTLTQKDRILRHLKDYGSITSWEAFTDYGITRLSAIIYTLRKSGYNIGSDMRITKSNRYGESTTFAKYELN